jgi:hypothetical protein
MSEPDLAGTDRFQQFVLLAVIELRARDDVPVHSFDVTGVCEDILEDCADLRGLLAGGVTRNRTITALNDLESEGHLAMETKQSPTGKGRPAYDVAIDEAAVLDALAADEQFEAAVERVRGYRE